MTHSKEHDHDFELFPSEFFFSKFSENNTKDWKETAIS